ncbi:YSIRK-type signal peptide-containing protein [Facklamia languida]
MEKNTRFSIRKLGIGVASVAVASFFACGTASAHNLEALTSSKANPEMPFAHVPVKIEFTQAESPWLPTNAPENTNDAIEYTDAEKPFAGRELPTAPVKANFDNPEAPFAPAKAEVEFTPAERPFAGRELPTPPLDANYNDPKAPFAPADQGQDDSQSIPWTDLTPAERIEDNLGLDQEQENPKDPEKKSIPWTELVPAERIEDNSDSDQEQENPKDPEKKSIPWTELVPAERIEDNSDSDQEHENPKDPEKESIPWTELVPAERIEDNSDSDQEHENPKDPEPETENSLNFAQTEMLKLINDFRLTNYSPKITYNPNVQPGTDLRSEEIAKHFAHERPNGDTWLTAFTEEGLGSAYGENIVKISKNQIKGAITEPEHMEELVNIFFIEWKNSPGHRRNMLDPNFSAVTFSIFADDTYYYGVQTFTAQKP